jgi:cyanobactin maturation PatA/PatG family protease
VLAEQINGNSEIAAIPGLLNGNVQLYSGQIVPVIIPEVRGLRNWTVMKLMDSLRASPARQTSQGAADSPDGLENYLTRIYYEFRNMGLTPQDRAMNFSGTNAFVVAGSFDQAAAKGLELDEIGVERSPICRQDSDCWDVKITFFDPKDTLSKPRTVFRFTVDVSDVVPVIVGPVRQWQMR